MGLTNTQHVNVIVRNALSLPAVEPSTPNSLPAQVMEWQLSQLMPPAMPTFHRKTAFLRTIAICMAISCWPERMFSPQQRAALMLRHLDKVLLSAGRPPLNGPARQEQITELLPFAQPASSTAQHFGLGELGHTVLLLIDLACEPQWFGLGWQRRQNADFNPKARQLASSLEQATTNGGRVSHLATLLRELNWALRQSGVSAAKSAQAQAFIRTAMWPLMTGRELPQR